MDNDAIKYIFYYTTYIVHMYVYIINVCILYYTPYLRTWLNTASFKTCLIVAVVLNQVNNYGMYYVYNVYGFTAYSLQEKTDKVCNFICVFYQL